MKVSVLHAGNVKKANFKRCGGIYYRAGRLYMFGDSRKSIIHKTVKKLDKGGMDFLRGGGEMGDRSRSFDWAKSSIGRQESWPFSLRSAVGLVLHSSMPMLLLWGKELTLFYNDAAVPIFDGDVVHPALGRSYKDIASDRWRSVGPLLNQVLMTAGSVCVEDQLFSYDSGGRDEKVNWTCCCSPAYNDDGKVAGVFVVCHEAKAKVKMLADALGEEDRLKFAVDAAELGTWELNPFTRKIRGNSRLKQMFGLKGEGELDFSHAIDMISKRDRPRVLAAIATALTYESGGRYDIEYCIENPDLDRELIVKARGRAYFDGYKLPYIFHGTIQDVTAEAVARRRMEDSEQFSNNVFYNSPVAKLVLINEEMTVARVNENMLALLGRDETIIGKSFFEAMPELLDTPLQKRFHQVLMTGEAFVQPEEKLVLLKDGQPYTGYYNYSYKALVSSDGVRYGVMMTVTEVTGQVVARMLIETKERELRDLISASPIGICVVSGKPVWVEEVNDRFLLIAGKTRLQFENAPYWDVMYDTAPLFEGILAEVFSTGSRYTSQEREMDLVRGGIPEKIFATFEYIPVLDADQLVTRVIIMTVEVTHQVEVRQQVEAAVLERTSELADSNLCLRRSNAELEQFAYIASHDLQEPIRKISTFMQLLENSIENISEVTKGYIAKIFRSTDRMTKLIRDVLAFSRVSDPGVDYQQVDLQKVMDIVLNDFELQIRATSATVVVNHMPVIEAVPAQMVQLFDNLLSNALKYKKAYENPVITVSASIATNELIARSWPLVADHKYYHVEFSDNGIGFDLKYVDQIFLIFQRLHSQDAFEGTGIGLAICQKIVHGHKGHISASVNESGGATFHLLLPETAPADIYSTAASA